jgi:hypothetical protein
MPATVSGRVRRTSETIFGQGEGELVIVVGCRSGRGLLVRSWDVEQVSTGVSVVVDVKAEVVNAVDGDDDDAWKEQW